MTRLVVVTFAAVGLILFVSFVVTRLLGSRGRGLSIRMQVFLALALIVGAFSFGLGLLVIDRVEARALRLAQAAAEDEAQALGALIESEIERTGVSFEGVAAQLERSVWSTTGIRTVSDSHGPTGLELLDARGNVLFPAGRKSLAAEVGAVFVDVPLRREGAPVGTVRVVKPTIVVQALLADFAPTVLVISLVLGAAAAVAAAWIGRAIARPIEGLSDFAERVSSGERKVLPGRVVGREVARLVQSIDLMQRQLEGRPFVETFAADLSHELKNPVAAIRASAEVLDDGALEEPERARRFVVRIQEATARIEKLLAELLDLARIETRGPDDLEPVRVDRLLETARAALEDGARLELPIGSGDVSVRGDQVWLGRALSNLLTNALVHSPSASRVTVQLDVEGDWVLLRTENDGTIPEYVRPTLFRRFVTTRRELGGTGLGLAIVRAVAEAHGGEIEVKAAGPPRVLMELRLPRR